MISRVIVNGALGKMGVLACKTIEEHPDFELVAALGRTDNLSHSIIDTKAHIVIDLTNAQSVYANCLSIINQGAHPIVGTSGLINEQITYLQSLAAEKKLGGIIVPNFSISAVLMMRFSSMAARFLPNVEIIEAHHPDKIDAPSATAIKTADMIAFARQTTPEVAHSRDIIPGARGASWQTIPIHSLRLPGVVAKQTVTFGSKGETLTIEHNSIDRVSFMPGLILACERVQTVDALYYGLEHFID